MLLGDWGIIGVCIHRHAHAAAALLLLDVMVITVLFNVLSIVSGLCIVRVLRRIRQTARTVRRVLLVRDLDTQRCYTVVCTHYSIQYI